ncbi:hypothetical protein [Streptomyces profundus]|uniref:hypothetical protein n=1 Tax=Streptomyces profundus TaxID=2867410 RepID=UPI001D16EA34|nr:hypothetical protein [Streptomyces sp. MA3_2.13]UED85287.1 hypothetical protein K4G22_14685 [Streptomyces sp. MA3_2.13]
MPNDSNTPQPMTHFYILSLELPNRLQGSWVGEVSVQPGTRRMDVFVYLRDEVAKERPEMARATPLFFSLEPVTV